jgi:hypothetical protein
MFCFCFTLRQMNFATVLYAETNQSLGFARYTRGLRSCQGCQKLWDRDINACDNIFKIAFCDCSGCKRPVVFDRSEQKGCKNVSHVS